MSAQVIPGNQHVNESWRRVVLECIRASVEGPFFPEWEFTSLFGIARRDVARIVASWPETDDDAAEVALAINNSMNNLLRYPHGREEDWPRFLSVAPDEVERIYLKWRAPNLRGRP